LILGLGLDVVAVERVRGLWEGRREPFLRRVFTEVESAACAEKADPVPSLAARFAAKEAGMKALGTGWARGVGWRDVEVTSRPGLPPVLAFHGRAEEVAASLGVTSVHLSLSHDAGIAAAVVVLEGPG